jgi:hypothetical protein
VDVISKLQAHYGVILPAGYCRWWASKYFDHAGNPDTYLWAHEAEWIPPEKIPDRDLWRTVIAGLVPFAFTGAGDHWCWNTQARTGATEYEVLFCYHDEELADAYAPSFPAWFYRNCLEYASSVQDEPEAILEARAHLRVWAERLSEIHSGGWSAHLSTLASAAPFEYHPPKLRPGINVFGFISTADVSEIVRAQFGPRYLTDKVKWGEWK